VPPAFSGVLDADEEGTAFYRNGDGGGNRNIAETFMLAETEGFICEHLLVVFRGNTGRFAKWHERNGGTEWAFDGAIIMLCSEKGMSESIIECFDIRKFIGVSKHNAEIREGMIGAAACHAEDANGAIPSFGEISEDFFEIVMLLIWNFNDFTGRIFLFFEKSKGFGCYGIEVADDGIEREVKFSGMFGSAISAEDRSGTSSKFQSRQSLSERATKYEERKIHGYHVELTFFFPKMSKSRDGTRLFEKSRMKNYYWFVFTCIMSKCGLTLVPRLMIS
jgi:hypothetical protein